MLSPQVAAYEGHPLIHIEAPELEPRFQFLRREEIALVTERIGGGGHIRGVDGVALALRAASAGRSLCRTRLQLRPLVGRLRGREDVLPPVIEVTDGEHAARKDIVQAGNGLIGRRDLHVTIVPGGLRAVNHLAGNPLVGNVS